MIDGRKGTFWEYDLQSEIPEHSESLGAGNLVNEVGTDKKLGRTIGKLSDSVAVPNFMEKGLTHKSLR